MVLRIKEDYDGAEPSANSVSALNLLRLSEMTGDASLAECAARLFRVFAQRMVSAGVTVPQLLVAFDFQMTKPRQVVLAGDRAAVAPLLREVQRRFAPDRVVFVLDSEETRQRLSRRLPALAGMTSGDGKATAYVCENFTCKLPVSAPEDLARLLDEGRA